MAVIGTEKILLKLALEAGFFAVYIALLSLA